MLAAETMYCVYVHDQWSFRFLFSKKSWTTDNRGRYVILMSFVPSHSVQNVYKIDTKYVHNVYKIHKNKIIKHILYTK